MRDPQPRFIPLAAKTVVSHTLTYLVIGALAYRLLHYAELMNKPCSGFKTATDPIFILGAPLQILRGVLFAAIFYPFREKLFGRRYGWLLMAWVMIGLGILGTFAAPAGSLEGFIYTTTPILLQMRGYLEICTQAVLLSGLLCYWVNHPGTRRLNWVLSILYAIAIALPVVGLLAMKR